MQTFVLNPKPPYDYEHILRRFDHAANNLYVRENKSVIRTIRVEGNIYLLRTTFSGDPDHPQLTADLWETAPVVSWDPVVRRVERMFSVQTDLSAFYRHLEGLPVLAPLAEQFYGLRILLESDLFESLIRTVIGQQLNLSFAAELNRRLIDYASAPLCMDGRLYRVFPSPEALARLTVDELMTLQFSRRKAEYVIDLANHVVAGRLNLDDLDNKDNETIVRELVRFRGVGRWTAECLLLFGLGRTDMLPAADIGLRNAVKIWYRLSAQPNEEEIRKIGSVWTPWSSYVTFYLWESLNNRARVSPQKERSRLAEQKKEIIHGEKLGGGYRHEMD